MPSCRAKIVCSSVDGAARSQQIFSVGIGLEASATLDLKTKLWGRHGTAMRVHVAQRNATRAARACQAPQAHSLVHGPRNSRD